MSTEIKSMGELFSEVENERIEITRRDLAEEAARWAAMTPEQRAAIEAERSRKAEEFYAAIVAAENASEAGEEEEDEEDEEDDEEAK